MKKTAQCETVPDGCLTDGHHVYWSPDETSVAKQCWAIGTRGPCEDGKLIHLEQNNEELEVYCRHQFLEYQGGGSLSWCPKGLRLNSWGFCIKKVNFYG